MDASTYNSNRAFRGLLSVLALIAGVSFARAQSYTAIDLGSEINLGAINDSGLATGS
jgi:hypothetical protein